MGQERRVVSNASVPDTAAILDALPDATLLVDILSYEVVYWNRAAEELYGVPEGARTYCHSLTHDSDEPCGAAGHPCPLETIFATGEPASVEHVHTGADGRLHHVRLHAAPLRDRFGRLRWITETHLDITERREAERREAAERARRQQYLDVARVMLLVLDTRGAVAEINPYGAELLAMPRSDVLGRDWIAEFVPPELRESMRGTFHAILAGHVDPMGDFEHEVVIAGGERRLMAFRNGLLHGDDGTVIGIISSAEDVTERRRMEARERDQREALERLHAIAADAGTGTADKLRGLLELGASILGTEHGGMSVREGGHCRLRYVHSPDGMLQPGQRVTHDLAGGIRIGAVDGGPGERFPESLSIAVEAEGRIRGALHFPGRGNGTDCGDYERDFLALLAQWAGYELERDAAYRALERAAIFDGLTGAYGRLHLEHRLEEELASARRLGHPVGLLMLDIDRFKSINDTYGHAVGDDVLRELVARLAGNLRASDLLARYGGEEFVAILPGTSLDGSLALAEKLRCQVADHPFPGVGEVTVSIGVAESAGEERPHDLLRRLDDVLYAAKRNGRDRVEVPPPTQ